MTDQTTILAVGDLMIGSSSSENVFDLVKSVIKSADIVIGQGEIPFTTRSVEKYYVEVPTEFFASASGNPDNMKVIKEAGFNVITLAGNHIWDSGVPGIEDTIKGFKKLGIAVTGAGMNIDEAKHPAIVEKNNTRFGVLDYNCVGPKLTWATPEKPGNAYIHVVTAYELEHPTPGGNPTIYTFATPDSLAAMTADIQKLRPLCDILVVCFHMGIGFTPAKIAMYEKQVSYMAVDAGADLVLGNHAHMMRGIEFYKGKPIYYGLNHFVLGGRSSEMPKKQPTWAIQNYMKKAKELFGPYFETDYHPEALRTMLAKCIVEDKRISRISFFLCLINNKGQPEILENDERGKEMFRYMEKITMDAGLTTQYLWDNNEVLVLQ